MYERILVAVDDSAASKAALIKAINLAKEHHAELRMVHVVDATAVPWDDEGVARPDRIWDGLVHASDKLLARAVWAAESAGCKAERAQRIRETARRKTSDLIADEAQTWRADLIVIGSRGRGPIRRALLGSVDAAVARVASMPVLSVRASQAARPGRRSSAELPGTTPGTVGLA